LLAYLVGGGKYNDNCATLELDRLNVRRQQQCQDLCEFWTLLTLFAAQWAWSISHIGRFRSAKKFPRLFTRTNSLWIG